MTGADQNSIPSWLRLDNAAKIYPAASNRRWMPLYRVVITLTEDADREILQTALEKTLERIPLFGYRLRRGLFWYYFEKQDRTPQVESDVRNPMLPLSRTKSRHFMFRLRCHKRIVALEIFHALADGAGSIAFLTTLIGEYLLLKHGVRMAPAGPMLDIEEAPRPAEWEDSFLRYARDATRPRSEETAWQIRGTKNPPNSLRFITGVLPTHKLLALAREKKTTVNTLLAAILFETLIGMKQKSRRSKKKPIKLSLPVNLRRMYPSQTLRNFSFYVNVPLRTDFGAYSFDNLIAYIGHYMGYEGMEPMLNARFSGNVKAEQNLFLRAAPLFVKTAVLKLMYKATGERYVTTTMTNLGRIDLPEEMRQYIEQIQVVLGYAQKTPLSCSVLSAFDKTCITFSVNIRETGVEKAFFTELVKRGVPVLIQSN